MSSGNQNLFALIDITLGLAKDIALDNSLRRIQEAQRQLLVAEADANRKKSSAVISAISTLDIEKLKLQMVYSDLKPQLTPQASDNIRAIIYEIENQRRELVEEKNNISSINNSKNDETGEIINGIKLFPGDILAVNRKSGLYQHFAVYIGNQKVIHYAAENGDFNGKISIHESSFTEFQADSTFVYVLDFPDESNFPLLHNINGKNSFEFEEESILFDIIRKSGYHLYSPEETISRAKSRIGEEKYSLPFNNCEHFAIWCKTGVQESHQVNIWITRLIKKVEHKLHSVH